MLSRAIFTALVLGVAAAPAQAQTAPRARPQTRNEAWEIITPAQATVVLARDGTLIGEIGRERRLSISLRTLPKYVGNAFIAVEDKRFYQHNGVDLVGIAGALKDAVQGDVRGASTITQLLVGNMHPDLIDRRDRSPGRKLREQQAAIQMEKRYSKEQILEAFLNQIAFGRGAYGIEMAARQYFGKGAGELTLAEAASLAAMPKSPVQYDPGRYPDRNRTRRNTVLALMANQGMITAVQAAAAQREPVRTVAPGNVAPWVTDVVRVQAERAGVPVLQGGYRIHTTIDASLQTAAQRALSAGIDEVETRPGFRGPRCAKRAADTSGTAAAARGAAGAGGCLEGAAVVIDPATGDVRALVGGRDYARSSFNRAVDGNRQPGSAFKAFVYAQAIATGLTANSPVADTALRITLDNGRIYSPDNSDGAFLGTLTMREALTRSRNPVAVQLGMALGIDSVAALAHRAGLRSPIAPFPSSALGASVVQPLDFVAAYATFDNGGVAVNPRFITRVEDRAGKTVFTPQGQAPTAAMDPRVAFIVRDMMQDVVTRGTATALRRIVPARIPVAGKTGTTNDNTDVWFVGMTPELVTGVWIGFDKPATITPGAVGGTYAAPIAGQIIAAAYANRSSGTWTPPPGMVGVALDRATGMVADSVTPAERRYTEWFLEGTQPGAPVWPWTLFRLGPILF
jgi:penicillin-binding protein 1A